MKAATIENVDRILNNIELQKTKLFYPSQYRWRFVLLAIFLWLLFFVFMDTGRGVCAEKNIGFVIEHGTEITQGVPVTIAVYPKSREEYGSIFIRPKAIIKVEVQ